MPIESVSSVCATTRTTPPDDLPIVKNPEFVLRMLFVRERRREWIIKNTGRFVKAYAVLLQIRRSFAVIPSEDH